MSAKAKATKVINPKHHHLVTPENAYIANTAVNYQEKSPRPSLTTSKNRKPILKGGLFMSFICTVFENHRKSLIEDCELRSYVYILIGQKFIKNAKK